MAANLPVDSPGHTAHERHMVELAYAMIALVVVMFAVGGYLYATNHNQFHCPTVTVATARC